MKTICVIVCLLSLVHVVFGLFRNAGSSSFGYDASSACSKPYARNAREFYEELPCDFRRQNWCDVAGSSYPWHAVRRFVHENQGLMKRMYGDEKYINVLKDELEKNDIELEYEDNFHSHANDGHFQRSILDEEYDYRYRQSRRMSSNHRESFSKGSKKIREFMKPEFRAMETSSPVSSTQQSVSSTQPLPANVESAQTTDNPLNVASTESSYDKPGEKTSVASGVTLAEIARIKNSSLNEIPGTLKMAMENSAEESTTQWPIEAETIYVESASEVKETVQSTTSTLSSIDRVGEVTEEESKENPPIGVLEQQFRPRPEYRPTERPEGQLFQDFISKDQQPILKLRGINACPVKDEVVAPFWANNTKGELLALLNLYPFQQFVHWERCQHEHKQMYCRDGCRCEQQYRLYRLLAYDPNNECRGIFSDWFRFPSCCVCRCYDLPVEFRVTSRSPRTFKQNVKVKIPENQWK